VSHDLLGTKAMVARFGSWGVERFVEAVHVWATGTHRDGGERLHRDPRAMLMSGCCAVSVISLRPGNGSEARRIGFAPNRLTP
jgi:hypothetical protein